MYSMNFSFTEDLPEYPGEILCICSELNLIECYSRVAVASFRCSVSWGTSKRIVREKNENSMVRRSERTSMRITSLPFLSSSHPPITHPRGRKIRDLGMRLPWANLTKVVPVYQDVLYPLIGQF